MDGEDEREGSWIVEIWGRKSDNREEGRSSRGDRVRTGRHFSDW